MRSSLLLLAASCLPNAIAWGNWGHESIGYIAQAFLGPKTLAFVQSVLDAEYNGQLGPAAIWADEVKYDNGWTWSQALHYIDANDDPLNDSCSVVDSRDCLGDCILTAITNYTTRILDTTLSITEQDRALKFLTHFIGDIGQPLHCEAYEVGGNDITEKFDGKKTELHAIWDTGMPEKTINGQFAGNISSYASALVTRIKSGAYASEAGDWISCTDPTLSQSSKRSDIPPSRVPLLTRKDHVMGKRTDLECPLLWAQDSNALVCSTVFTGYLASDLGTDYYTANAPIVDVQIAKSGYRLAAWLNTLFDGEALP